MAAAGLRGRRDQPEVGHLDRTGPADQHVLRLDVPVHQAVSVRFGEPGQHRPEHGDRRRHAERAVTGQDVAQGAALDELHDEEHHRRRVGPVTEPARPLVVHVDDRGMVDPGGRAGLTLEPRTEGRVRRQARVHHLDRHGPVEARVDAAVHHGHPAPGQHGAQAVAPVEQSPGSDARNVPTLRHGGTVPPVRMLPGYPVAVAGCRA
jgi:hypothetical protein